MPKIKALITMPCGNVFREVFVEKVLDNLAGFAEVTLNSLDRNYTTEELVEAVRGMDAVITGWGVPVITGDVLRGAPTVRIIAHAAGSVKHFVTPEVFDCGVMVTNAASVMAPSVGEHALALTLALLRNIPQQNEAMHEGQLKGSSTFTSNEGLFEQRVGLVGFGHTGREFVKLLKPFRAEAVVYDPYCPKGHADEYGVILMGLDELLSTSKVVSIHAPITEETRGMISAEKLKLLRDGSVFINTARGILVDHDALAEELKTGRIKAALDVTYPEPLPADHQLRRLPNVILTPHIAGPTWDRRWCMADAAVNDVKLFFEGKKPVNMVTREMLDTMA